jgi:putative peptide zinc metalloprotease protein
VRVGLREDLDVSRHLFRKEPFYVVRDPLTFQSQRLSLADYEIFVRIGVDRSLADIFKKLVDDGRLAESDEESFYRFVMSLHRLGFLHLPVSDHKLLYRRSLIRDHARRRQLLTGILFLRIPLINPDALLARTVHLVRPLFSRAAFAAWVVLIACAAVVAIGNWRELAQPLQGVLVARNLPLIWLTLIILKVFHEFGHAFACKNYGGHVPEMGAYMILFTPCAYMDASASWGFTRKRERIFVCLAGMYVEVAIAAIAVFVWAMSDGALVKSVAYNVIFLAGAVTVFFNINPLMRYDGYYILSDFVEVPNLRQRAQQHVLGILKRRLLGIQSATESVSKRLHFILTAYGVAASIYRVLLMVGITALIISKMFYAGLLLGTFFLGGFLFKNARKLLRYLWYAREASSARYRAVALSLIVLVLIPAAGVFVPLPARVEAAAMVARENERVIRVTSAGFLERVVVQPGQFVERDDLLVELTNDAVLEEIAHTQAGLSSARIRMDAFRQDEPSRALQAEIDADMQRELLAEARAKRTELSIGAQEPGEVIDCVRTQDQGIFFAAGDPIATIVSGNWELRVLLTEQQWARVRPQVGDSVAFRAYGSSGADLAAKIAKIARAGSRSIDILPLSHLSGGEIAVDPLTREATQPYFEVVLSIPEAAEPSYMESGRLRCGMTGTVQFSAVAEPLAKSLGRRFNRFWNRLQAG